MEVEIDFLVNWKLAIHLQQPNQKDRDGTILLKHLGAIKTEQERQKLWEMQ
jgi:hypothetical protein